MMWLIALVWMHFLADFMLQSHKMSINKSKSNKWLLYHVLVYSLIWCVFGWRFWIINAILHFVVDWFTSRGTSYLWKKQEVHWFFCLVGFDQAIHLTTLILLYNYLVKPL